MKLQEITLKNDFPKKDVTIENVLDTLPASPGDIFWKLGRVEDYQDRAKSAALRGMLDKLVAEKKVRAKHRTADDPVYYKV
jgi:hypothetical protein